MMRKEDDKKRKTVRHVFFAQVGDILLMAEGRKKKSRNSSATASVCLSPSLCPLLLGLSCSVSCDGGREGVLKLHLLNRDQPPSFVW